MILTAWRYGAPTEHEVEDEEEAVGLGWSFIEHNTAAPDVLRDDDGTIVLDHVALRERIEEYDRRLAAGGP